MPTKRDLFIRFLILRLNLHRGNSGENISLKVFLSNLARKFHPDHNQEAGATEEFKLIKEAYETLKDPQKKLMYDSGVS